MASAPEAASPASSGAGGVGAILLDEDLLDLPVAAEPPGSDGSETADASVSEANSSSDSSSSSSSGSTGEGSCGDDASEVAVPRRSRRRVREESPEVHQPATRQRRAETFEWRGFRFTFKPATSGRSSYMVLCRYHSIAGEATKCTRTAGWSEEAQREDVVRRLKTWCINAPRWSNRQEHQSHRGIEVMTDEQLAAAVLPPLPS